MIALTVQYFDVDMAYLIRYVVIETFGIIAARVIHTSLTLCLLIMGGGVSPALFDTLSSDASFPQ